MPLLSILKKMTKRFSKAENESNLRETLEELIEDSSPSESSIDMDEKVLLGNVLSLRDSTAHDVMIPRADIIAVPVTISGPDLIAIVAKTGHSRFPVYRDTLDNAIGMVQVKDILGWSQSQKPLKVRSLVKEILFIAPSMRTLDLIFQMKETGVAMALVVDEYGGIDGLVTLSDLMEEIIGDIQDVQDQALPQLQKRANGTVLADARVTLEEAQEKLSFNFSLQDLDEDIETLGGLVITLAGRVPVRGELIRHPNGVEFEIIDADPRRVKKLCIHGL